MDSQLTLDSYDEDCLFLNIWTKPQTGAAKKAVMVWIYGNAFEAGSSTLPQYNGTQIAENQDVILVSLK
jgi:cholinesterase